MFYFGVSLAVIAAFAAAFAAVIVLLTSFVSIHENQVGVVVKRFSRSGSLPEGRIVALNGEAGFQAATLPPGIHFGYWPWQYKVMKHQLTTIEQGHIGLVIANDGSPTPVDRVLSNVVDCDFFQDGAKFMRSGGQKGRQTSILTAGYYRINPVLFKVIPNVRITSIGSDKIGIVTVLDGAPMPVGQMAAPTAAGHDDFQSPDAFIKAGGARGLQEQIILAGTYNINPWFCEIEEHSLFEVPIGYVGVVVSFVGDDARDISGDEFTHGNIVRRGGKGLWD